MRKYEDLHIAHLPVMQIPWVFKDGGPPQTAWMGKTLMSLVFLGGGLVFAKVFFLMLQLLWLISLEDLMF